MKPPSTCVTPTNADLVQLWEENVASHPLERGLAVLDLAMPESVDGEWRCASIGDRDAALLGVREAWFGAELETTITCPNCGERLEVSFNTRQIATLVTAGPTEQMMRHVEEGGYRVEYRHPTSEDLIAVLAAFADDASAAAALQRRCIVSATLEHDPVEVGAVPAELLDRVGDRMREEDPALDWRFALRCSDCQHQWRVGLDIASLLWGDLEEWVHRLFDDVVTLASALGWSEREIVGMQGMRRRVYVEMVRS